MQATEALDCLWLPCEEEGLTGVDEPGPPVVAFIVRKEYRSGCSPVRR